LLTLCLELPPVFSRTLLLGALYPHMSVDLPAYKIIVNIFCQMYLDSMLVAHTIKYA